MQTLDIAARRGSVVSSKPFARTLRSPTRSFDRPAMNAVGQGLAAQTIVTDLKEVVQGAVGSSDLMEFVRFDAGAVLRKERGGQASRILRLVVGNPLIM